MKLLFATQNNHKLEEVRAILGNEFEIISPADLNFSEELPETHSTIEENAEEKADFVFQHFNMNCFSEDTGLEIKALTGEPGVYSARYAGEGKNAIDNIDLVLQKMNDKTNRNAKFRTVICLILDGEKYFFEGITEGKILNERQGKSGFGYDPIFVAEGNNRSYAEMNLSQKNEISHRKKAFEKMKEFLSLRS